MGYSCMIGFESLLGIFIFTIAYRSTRGPVKLLIQPILGLKRLKREADHSPPSSAKVKTALNYSPINLHIIVLDSIQGLTFFCIRKL
jgi:hypothetical protein